MARWHGMQPAAEPVCPSRWKAAAGSSSVIRADTVPNGTTTAEDKSVAEVIVPLKQQ